MHDSATVANAFLDLAEEEGVGLTPMKLLKLVYIAHGWTLGLHARPLIREEVEAWPYGPVIRDLYEAVRRFKDRPVTGRVAAPAHDELDATERDLVRQVFDIYGRRSGPALSKLTHLPGSPWARTYSGDFGERISNDLIEDYYQRKALGPAAARDAA